MAIYSGNFQIIGPYQTVGYSTTVAGPMADLITKSTTGRVCVLEACLQTTTAPTAIGTISISISRSTNTPVQSGQTYLIAENPSDGQSITSVATAWSIAPTVTPATTVRRYNWNAGQPGNGVIFSFIRGLSVSPTNSIVISSVSPSLVANQWAASGANVVNGYFVVNE
mgnify:CR=1 FL=1